MLGKMALKIRKKRLHHIEQLKVGWAWYKISVPNNNYNRPNKN